MHFTQGDAPQACAGVAVASLPDPGFLMFKIVKDIRTRAVSLVQNQASTIDVSCQKSQGSDPSTPFRGYKTLFN
jgi:hypothetical protein